MSLRNHDWREVLNVFSKFGFYPKRQSGSHIILKNSQGVRVSVPRKDPIPEGTLRAIVQEAGIVEQDFIDAL